jgi:hypothetical protein
MHLQDWDYLGGYLEGPMEGKEYVTPRLQLRDNNNAPLMDAYREIYVPNVHAGRPAHLGHGLRQKLLSFFMQLSTSDLLALSMPPTMEQMLIKKYKLNKDGHPMKTLFYLGKNYENNVQL